MTRYDVVAVPHAPVDVLVVGAGPVGLLVALESALGGARVRVLERSEAPSAQPKAFGIGPLAGEALERRGLSAAIAAAEARAFAGLERVAHQPGAAVRGRDSKVVGHVAGLPLIRRDAQLEPHRRPRAVDQQAVEAMLTERALALGVEIGRECDVTSVAQDDDGAEVTCRTPSGTQRHRGTFLVGCDGGRSLVRKAAGFAFPGTPATSTFYQATVDLDHPERLLPIGWHRTSGGMFSYGPFPGRLAVLDFAGPPGDRDAPVTREEIERVLRRAGEVDVRVRALANGSRWGDNTRLADRYRRGRVFLAGDAAHVHTPFGGQGLGLGLVDAANLGWKLAAVVRGERPESFLESYAAERRSVAEAVLANTLAQIAIMRPDPQSGAMRDLFARLMAFDDVNRLVGTMTTGLGTRYDLDSDDDEVGRLAGDRALSGDAGAGTLYAAMQDGRGVLLDASSDAAPSRIVANLSARVRRVAVPGGPSMLLRPDACVAWRASAVGETAGLEKAVRRWFGSASDR